MLANIVIKRCFDMTKTNNTFGKFIRARRESIGKSLRGAAADLGIAPPYMSDLENDRRYPPTANCTKTC